MTPPASDLSQRLTRLEVNAEHRAQTLEELDQLVRGSDGLNLRDRVLILWHSQLWILALASTVVGCVLQKMLDLL